MRWAAYSDSMRPRRQRREIMLRFIRETRSAGRRRPAGGALARGCVCHRVCRVTTRSGVDLEAWVAAGVDWVNLSCHYVSEQQTDLAATTG